MKYNLRKCFRLIESSSLRLVMLLFKNTLILMIFIRTCHSQAQLNEQKLSFKCYYVPCFIISNSNFQN